MTQANAQLTTEEKALVEAELTTSTEEVEQATAEVAAETGEEATPSAASDDPTSAATPPAETKEEKPKEETPEQKAARESQEKTATWKSVEAAKKQHIQNVRLGEQLKTERSKVAEQSVRLEQQSAQLQRQAEHIQRQASEIRSFTRALAEGDSGQVLATLGRLRGVTPDEAYRQLTRAALEAGTPEGIARRSSSEVEALRRELRQRDEQELSRAQVNANRKEAMELVRHVDESPEEFPELYEWPPERVAQEGIAIRDQIMRAGGRVTYDEVLKQLSYRAKTEAEQAQARRTRRTQQGTNGATRPNGQQSQKAATNGNGHQADRPKAPNTPQGVDAVKKATPPRERTEEEIDAECLSMLRGLPGGSAKTA